MVNQATRRALRRRPAATREPEKDGRTVAPSGCEDLRAGHCVGISGFPGHTIPAGAQYRALGAASLECCAVAEGVLDAYLVVGVSTLHSWDYLAGLLVCREVGAADDEREGRDLIVRDASSRRPVVAATRALADRLVGEEGL